MGFECKSNLVQSPVATAHKTEHNLSQLATSTERNLQVPQYYKVYICCQRLLSAGAEDGEQNTVFQLLLQDPGILCYPYYSLLGNMSKRTTAGLKSDTTLFRVCLRGRLIINNQLLCY